MARSDRVRTSGRPCCRKYKNLSTDPACPVRQFMSLIGLLTATEKQVHFGRLHKRPIQWHLKNNWRVPESLEKVIPLPKSLHPHLKWWLEEINVLQGQPLHPIKHALQIFTDASKEGWGTHLDKHTARGTWSLPERKLHNKLPRTKSRLFGPERVPRPLFIRNSSCSNRHHHSGVIHKQGRRHEVGSTMCPLVENPDFVYHKTGDPQSPTHSRLGQTIQTEWSLLPGVLQTICNMWHQPQIDLFATRFNKLPLFVSPIPDPLASAVDALSLPWEDLDAYAFPPAAILGKVVEKLQDSPCKRIILIAPWWPNMPWFWDLLAMSSQIPPSLPNLPNLLTQAFNQIPHRNLTSESPCMAPRASAIKEQGFSVAVAVRIEAPQRGSTRSVYEAKWTIFTKCCGFIRWTSGHPL